MIYGTGVAILSSVFPEQERGRALGLSVAATYLGLSLGPVLGGFLTKSFGWRSIFLANVPFGALAIVLVFWKLKGEWAEAKGERFDLVGSVVYGLSLVGLMYGFSVLPSVLGIVLVLGGIIGILSFIWWETRTTHPVLDIDLFRGNRVFAFSNLAALIHYSAGFATGFLLSLYLQSVRALQPQEAGLILVAQPIVMTIFSPLAGRFSDRTDPRLIASAGIALTAIGLLLLASLNTQTSIAFIVLVLVLSGLGFALFSAPNTHAIMGSIQRRSYGVAAATLGTMRLTGQMLSMGIATVIISLYVGRGQITAQTSSLFLASMKTIFAVFAALCVGGVFASLMRGKLQRYGQSAPGAGQH